MIDRCKSNTNIQLKHSAFLKTSNKNIMQRIYHKLKCLTMTIEIWFQCY